jgi:hypothetical protein
VIARKFDSKGNAGSEFSEPPASFIAARTFVLDDTSYLYGGGSASPFNLCASAAIYKKMLLFKDLIARRSNKFRATLAA